MVCEQITIGGDGEGKGAASMTERIFSSRILMIALAISGPSIPKSYAQGAGKVDREVSSSERERRAMAISEVASAVGISSGTVIVYGHPLHPPYHFEYRAALLFINGVQIEPSLVLQREDDKKRPKISADEKAGFQEQEELDRKIQRRYFEQKGKVSDSDLRAELIAIVRAHPRVKDAQWTNDFLLSYHAKGRFEGIWHGISLSPPRQRNPKQKSPEDLKHDHIADLEKHLRDGGCIVWGTTGPWFKPEWQCKEMKKNVRDVMESATLSDPERQERLQTIFGGADPSADMITNYKRDEWK
jgi:hypothetical protein